MSKRNQKKSEKNVDLLNQDLLKYSVLVGSALMMSKSADAAIQYTNPVDLVVLPGVSHTVDLDNDGNPEATFNISTTTTTATSTPTTTTTTFTYTAFFASVQAGSSASILGNSSSAFSSYYSAIGLPANYSIGSSFSLNTSYSWMGSAFFHYVNTYSSYTYYPWALGTTSYVGVMFDIGGNTHYGWIQYRSDTLGKGTILDWAYEDQPDTPIKAGAKPVVVPPPAPTPTPTPTPAADDDDGPGTLTSNSSQFFQTLENRVRNRLRKLAREAE